MHNPFLIGEQIYLRATQHSDAPLIATFLNDPEVNRRLLHHRPISPEQEAERLAKLAGSPEHVLFGIVQRESNQLLGVTGLHEIDTRHRKAEFGILIGEKSFWGKGIGSEATRLQLKYAFDTLNLHRVELDVQEDNVGAIRAYEKAGFVTEGLKREAYWGSGRWQNLVLMAAFSPHH